MYIKYVGVKFKGKEMYFYQNEFQFLCFNFMDMFQIVCFYLVVYLLIGLESGYVGFYYVYIDGFKVFDYYGVVFLCVYFWKV